MSLLLTLNIFHIFSNVFVVDIGQVIAYSERKIFHLVYKFNCSC